MSLAELKKQGEAPEWMTDESYKTLSAGYLLPGETPKMMYKRVADSAAAYAGDPALRIRFFEAMYSNWLCPASPILSNAGTKRGLPISCNSTHVHDSVNGILNKAHELAMLSKHGAGVGIYLGDVRGRGASISGNGVSEGVVPWAKIYDSVIASTNQGSTRRGAAAVYLPVDHGDIKEFINIRKPTGDLNSRCLNLHHGVCIDDEFMKKIEAGDKHSRELWIELLKNRVESGEPYMFFTDNVNKSRPEAYVKNNLYVKTSNICCLSGETLVLTKEGPARIDSLTGKTVHIWDGLNWVENSSFKERGVDELIRIHLSNGSYVDSNENHRWFAAKDYEDIRKSIYEETLTKDIKVGFFLESHNQETNGTVEASGAYIKGFLVGDGTSYITGYGEQTPLLNLHFTKYLCEAKILESVSELPIQGGLKNCAIVEPSFSEEKTGDEVQALGRQRFKRLRGLSARRDELYIWAAGYKQMFPMETLEWDRKSKLAFLAGLFDSDGTISQSNCNPQLASVHEDFIDGLQLFLKTLGIDSSKDKIVRKHTDMSPGGDYFRLTANTFDFYKILEEAPFQRLKYKGKKPNRKTTGWRRVVRIEKITGTHKVYCPVLPSTGKFGLANGLMTGNTEITLYTDPDHSFVCCLSSLNLVKYDEWKNSDVVELATVFLDAILSEYIEKATGIPGFEAAIRSAEKGRAIGIGVLGWHTLLQEKNLAFDSFEAMRLNAEIFKSINDRSLAASKDMATKYGEPEWCKGLGVRNTHRVAVAPTASNSIISGSVSAGIEPIAANAFALKTAKGTFFRKNKTLESILLSKDKNEQEVWKSIIENDGSIQHLSFLDEQQKAVFLTAREISQFAIIRQAAQRQKFIDQGQSVNLFFGRNSDPKYIHEVHMEAWRSGLKTLYYCRAESVLKGDSIKREKYECKACEA
jgi:ribonucleoside-diphosphate reductase alpha chain